MSIEDFKGKIKGLAQFKPINLPPLANDLFIGLILVLVAIGAFGLGRLSKIEGSKVPIRIENAPQASASVVPEPPQVLENQSASAYGAEGGNKNIVASKSGTKYYYTWCGGVQKISIANRIYFSSQQDAKAAGYTPSSTCKGL